MRAVGQGTEGRSLHGRRGPCGPGSGRGLCLSHPITPTAPGPRLGETKQVVPVTRGRCRDPIRTTAHPLRDRREPSTSLHRSNAQRGHMHVRLLPTPWVRQAATHSRPPLCPLQGTRQARKQAEGPNLARIRGLPGKLPGSALGLLVLGPHGSLDWALPAAPCALGTWLPVGTRHSRQGRLGPWRAGTDALPGLPWASTTDPSRAAPSLWGPVPVSGPSSPHLLPFRSAASLGRPQPAPRKHASL